MNAKGWGMYQGKRSTGSRKQYYRKKSLNDGSSILPTLSNAKSSKRKHIGDVDTNKRKEPDALKKNVETIRKPSPTFIREVKLGESILNKTYPFNHWKSNGNIQSPRPPPSHLHVKRDKYDIRLHDIPLEQIIYLMKLVGSLSVHKLFDIMNLSCCNRILRIAFYEAFPSNLIFLKVKVPQMTYPYFLNDKLNKDTKQQMQDLERSFMEFVCSKTSTELLSIDDPDHCMNQGHLDLISVRLIKVKDLKYTMLHKMRFNVFTSFSLLTSLSIVFSRELKGQDYHDICELSIIRTLEILSLTSHNHTQVISKVVNLKSLGNLTRIEYDADLSTVIKTFNTSKAISLTCYYLGILYTSKDTFKYKFDLTPDYLPCEYLKIIKCHNQIDPRHSAGQFTKRMNVGMQQPISCFYRGWLKELDLYDPNAFFIKEISKNKIPSVENITIRNMNVVYPSYCKFDELMQSCALFPNLMKLSLVDGSVSITKNDLIEVITKAKSGPPSKDRKLPFSCLLDITTMNWFDTKYLTEYDIIDALRSIFRSEYFPIGEWYIENKGNQRIQIIKARLGTIKEMEIHYDRYIKIMNSLNDLYTPNTVHLEDHTN